MTEPRITGPAPAPATPAPAAPVLPDGPAALRAHVAQGLSAAAGRHNFSNRRRRFDVGFSERRRAGAIRAFARAGFALLVALPMALAGVYYGWLAEDRYEVESRMILRVNQAARPDRLSGITGLPSIEMQRDTQVIAEYLGSAGLVAELAAREGLRARWTGPAADPLRPETWIAGDWVARLAPDAPAEDLHARWEALSGAEIELPAGIVVFRLQSFTPEGARDLSAAAIAAAEALVERLNARVWADAVAKAEALFRDAADRLAAAQARLAVARNEAGVLDTEAEAGALSALASSTRAELIRLEQDHAAQAQHLAPSSARLQALSRRIASLKAQLAALGRERVGAGAADGRSLAEVMARFAEIEVEQELAERQFLAAAAKLEEVRQVAEARMMYLDVFVEPALPEEPSHPRRALWLGVILTACLALWGAAAGLFATIRNHMA
ncbi:hypothetical protein LNKW23_00300 [Paralimibaculum aggregatum]|uniref:Capsule biosynthesis protein n=1 Tax=Paralimibaculum aggregatum TaxID=3036245 RepID=A0ABQ6LI01_9RHOB|nr:hypothetical protein [Limibaculum sp. NKW23]GMG80818.1 hypothetical protein LNKW23_00300 [Limibaculum sp. NKW23]